MPRKPFISPHRLQTDYIFQSRLLGSFLYYLQKNGKKSIAERIVYQAMTEIYDSTDDHPVRVFEQAMRTVTPELGIITTKKGRSIRYYPVRLRSAKKLSFSFEWILKSARKKRGGKKMGYKLAREIIGTAQNNSTTIKKKRALYKKVKDNRMYRLRRKDDKR